MNIEYSIRKYLEFGEKKFTVPTVGLDTTILQWNTKYLNKYDIRIFVKDIPGQLDRFRSISSVHYRGAHAAAFLCSMDDLQSVYNLESWMNDLKNSAPDDIECMLLINKFDILKSEELKKDKNNDNNNNNNNNNNNINDDNKDNSIIKQYNKKHSLANSMNFDHSNMSRLDKARKVLETGMIFSEKYSIPQECTSGLTGLGIINSFNELIKRTLNNNTIWNRLKMEYYNENTQHINIENNNNKNNKINYNNQRRRNNNNNGSNCTC